MGIPQYPFPKRIGILTMNDIDAAAKDFLTVVKVLHFIDGVKFCDCISNLDFDWKLVRRKPSPTWPGIVYLASRVASMACVVSFLVGLNASSQINCQAWVSTAFTFPLLELELALLLIVIRVIAIWKCSSLATCLAAIVLSLHSGVSLHLLTGIHSFFDPGVGYQGCVIYAPRMYLISMSIATITTYALLLIAMLVGLLRQRQARSFGVWNMLFQQGWAWLALAVVTEVPTLFLVLLNMNYSLNVLLQVPRVVIASIGTTTMFRILHNYHGRRYARPRRLCGYGSELAWGLQGHKNDYRSSAAQTRSKHNLSIICIASQPSQGFRAYHNYRGR
ncbi:hypothetical protein BC827DRAFT_801635 [Russula dissimulans]|nr:hypothetical protein BC827DRAFT_801635 [Russula dissimulans]